MKIIIGCLFYLVFYNSPLYASDIEEILPSNSAVSYVALTSIVADPDSEKIEESDFDVTSIPKDVWFHIFKYLSLNDQLSLRGTSESFRKLAEKDPNFLKSFITKLDFVEQRMLSPGENLRLLLYVKEWGHFFAMLERYPIECKSPIILYRNKFETLWRLRYVSQIDMGIIRNRGERYGFNPKPEFFKDIASMRLGLQVRRSLLMDVAQILLPTSAFGFGLWSLFKTNVLMVRVTEMPWVQMRMPPCEWSMLTGYMPIYSVGINFDALGFLSNCVRGDIASVNNHTLVRRSIDSLAYYVGGVEYLSIPYVLCTGAVSMTLMLYNLNSPYAQTVSYSQAEALYRKASGAAPAVIWKRRFWLGAKFFLAAGVTTLVVANVVGANDFIANYVSQYSLSYTKGVESLKASLWTHYIAYKSYSLNNLRLSKFSPFNMDNFCFTFLEPEVFSNHTSIFKTTGLMDFRGWKFPNMPPIDSYLYSNCASIFGVLDLIHILHKDSLIHILYPKLAVANVTGLQTDPALILTGSWALTVFPQIIMTLHIMYMLLIAVW